MNAYDILQFIDATRLVENDSQPKIQELCQLAHSDFGNTAAVCVYPEYVSYAYNLLKKTPIKIATVANFPHGNQSLQDIKKTVDDSIQNHADEIDIVLPYHDLIENNTQFVIQSLAFYRKITHGKILKIIIETGALATEKLIRTACQLVIDSQADFIKTSTGKNNLPGANVEVTETILQEILAQHAEHDIGVKLSGGIRSINQAQDFLMTIKKIMGAKWLNSHSVRIGASSLVTEIIQQLEQQTT